MIKLLSPSISLIKQSYYFFSQIKDINSQKDLPKSPSSYLLQFHASWCPPCKQLTPRLTTAYNEEKQRNFDLYRVDIDKAKDLARKYDVAAVPMLVGIVNEKTVCEEVGLAEKNDIVRIFDTIERETKKLNEKLNKKK